MARKAAAANSRIQTFVRNHPEEIRVGLIAAAVALLFTHGLPLWDDDYGTYLAQANEGFLKLLGRLILPFTNEPQTWGYGDHPVQVLLYKIYSTVFGTWSLGYFILKSAVFGGLCGALYHWMGRLGIDRTIRYFSLALFALSTNAVAALVQHSDFHVYSQLLMVVTLLWAMPQIERGPSSTAVYKKGIGNLPAQFRNFLITFFCVTYFGAKLGADMRMVPVVLAAHLFIFHRERFNVYAAPFGIALAATLPWSAYFFKHLPPFVPGAKGYEGMTYAEFNLGRVAEFLVTDVFSIRTAPLSILGGVGLLATIAALAYGGYRVYRDRLEQPDHRAGFFLIWLGCTAAAMGTVARLDHNFVLRHTFLMLVPATMLFAMIAQAASREFGKVHWFRHALMAGIVVQAGLHFYHDCQFRRDMGRTMVAVDKLYAKVEHDHPQSQLLLSQGFSNYGFRETVPALVSRKPLVQGDDVGKYAAGNTFLASWGSTLDARMSVDYVATGCGTSLFDAVFSCDPSDGAVLLKYVGTPAEIAQADQLDKAGNLAGAFAAVDSYLQKDPDNHGAGFIAGLYAYRMSNTKRMLEIYDKIGPFFPWHVAVVYNWGLAKQASQQFPDALKLFEKAYAMAPRDYAVGYNLADTYMRVNKKNRAIATIDTMLKIYPNDGAMRRSREEWDKK